MNDSGSNRWKRAERHPEKHQILMQSFFALFSVDRQFFCHQSIYIYMNNAMMYKKEKNRTQKKMSDFSGSSVFSCQNHYFGHQSQRYHRDSILNDCVIEVIDLVDGYH